MAVVSIADFGTGNLHSVCNAFEALGKHVSVHATRRAEDIRNADRLVLPGQGAIGTWMNELANNEIRDAVEEAFRTKPILGICLGLQALYARSEEDGGVDGLQELNGEVKRFDAQLIDSGRKIKIPHMGWSPVKQECEHPLWQGIPSGCRFYFVHSYYAAAENSNEIAGTTQYGLRFTSAAMRGNLFAVQFHPEKSRQQGLKLLSNFINWDGSV